MRRGQNSRITLYALLFVVLVLGFAVGTGLVWWKWAEAPVGGKRIVRVMIPKGIAAEHLGELLQSKGVVRSSYIFALSAKKAAVTPGTYDLSPSETPTQILRHLVRGDVATVRETFPEGFTAKQIAHRLAKGELADEAQFLQIATEQGTSLKASFPLPTNLEGYLFPDTYKFPVGSDAKSIAQRMIDNFERVVTRNRADALQKSGHSLQDIVIVASMVEREAEKDADRPRIASVIYNRLSRSMPLQIDATVQYALPKHKARLMNSDLKIDSPYNTYRVHGLPPGAICNPGIASINAALHPAASDYLYYVARADGFHLFGRTWAEHRHNIALVRRDRHS